MIRRFALLSVVFAGSALAQQNTDISEKDVTSGAAQGKLSALARQAEISGKRVVVTAPQHLHAQIAAALHAGGKADIVLKDGFYENVLVRIEEKAAEPPKPEAKPAAPPRAVAATPRPAPAPPPAPVVAPPPPAAAVVEAPPAVVQKAPEPIEKPAAVPTAPPVAETPFESPPVAPAAVASPTRAAPARSANVAAPPSAKPVPGAPPNVFSASEPGDVSPVRTSLEKLYNEGRRITSTIAPTRLRSGDLLYTGAGAAVVVRREGPALVRYWLEGSLDLAQSGIELDSGNKYRVIGATIR